MNQQYQPSEIEQKAQTDWQKKQIFKAEENKGDKFYCLTMFPYPSGTLHMGHVRNYTIGDVIARYERMQGKDVLYPMGWDAFGLPAENAAIKHKASPSTWTYQNIDKMREQFIQLGMSFDWSKELATCDPEYYKWEQWLFIQLYKKGLVYRKDSVVNWDPVDHTVLANEQVIDGRGWRSGALVEKKSIPQWFIKITDYADELLADLDKLPGWPDKVKTMQKNWIGRSSGVELNFEIKDRTEHLTVFTTRVDTLYGVDFIAIAAQHPIALELAKTNANCDVFVKKCQTMSTMEADLATLEKEGVDTGLVCINPLSGKQTPIWITNYVLMEYGSGAVMGVPGHDERDNAFAQKYNLPITQVVKPLDDSIDVDVSKAAFNEAGTLINSAQFDGLNVKEGIKAITAEIEKMGAGKQQVNYRLRDWGVSRQRYWGTPIPMVFCDHCGDVPVNESDLPVKLPENVQLDGTQSPLKTSPEFYETTCPSCGRPARRETDTFDTFMESSWYYARYTCPGFDQGMLNEAADYWCPVDHYIGGIEHAVMHLLYARFFHKLLRDQGLVKSDEPFTKLLTQGMVLKDGAKMSKSKGNVVDPNTLIDKYGADTVRLFSMFAAPAEQDLEWSDSGVEGAYKFIKKIWSIAIKHEDEFIHLNTESQAKIKNSDTRRELHTILKQINHDMDRLQFNTIVSGAMKIANLISKLDDKSIELKHECFKNLLLILAPFTPHVCDKLWQDLQFGDDINTAPWPKVDENALVADEFNLIVQVNGKLRAKLNFAMSADQAQIEADVKEDENIKRFIEDKTIRKVIYVPKKLLNLVVS